MSKAADREVLDTGGVADLLGVSRDAVRDLIRDYGLPAHRFGRGHWKFIRTEVLDWLREQPGNIITPYNKKVV